MKRSRQQCELVTQLVLFEDPGPGQAISLPEAVELQTETKEAYELRHTKEMAEKLGWPALCIEPIRAWPGVTILEGKDAWDDVLKHASSGTVGLLMLALHKQLDPLARDSIDEKTGLHRRPVEVISQMEERLRRRMIQLAELSGWPRISYWVASTKETIGPGEGIWRTYFTYGCCGQIADAVGALERRMQGEPEQTKRTMIQQVDEEES